MIAFSDFHLLRPMALWALIPLLLAVVGLLLSKRNSPSWQKVIAPHLLPFLADGKTQRSSTKLVTLLGLFWLFACIALAGPTWEQAPSQVHRNSDALVVMLDLSPSMTGDDIKPSRVVRARIKIAELLKQREEGDTALIAYADQAYVVTPLTEDANTITSLLGALSPATMPSPGSRVEAAVERATKMLTDAGYQNGHLLIITDGIDRQAEPIIAKALAGTEYRLSILGIGSDKPVPIPSGRGGFIRDSQGNVVTTSLQSGQLQRLARRFDGRYATATYNTADLDYLLQAPLQLPSSGNHRLSDNKMDSWIDRGPWLVLFIMPLALLAFRRGILSVLILVGVGLAPAPETLAQSSTVDNLLLTPDQRGAKAMQLGNPEQAASEFNDPAWRGAAQYRAGQYEAAAQTFATLDTAEAHYNRGNALAQNGQLDQAIDAYNKALKLDPELDEARANKALVERIKEQQQNSSEQNEGQDGEQNQSEQEQEQDQSQQNQQQAGGQSSSSNSEEQPNDNSQSSSSANSPQTPDNPSPADGQNSSQGSSASSEQAANDAIEEDTATSSSDAQQQQSSSQASENNEGEEQQLQAAPDQPLTAEELEKQQAQEQWLRNIPDDPSGLLRNKFKHEHQKNRTQRQFQKLNDFGAEEQRW